MASPAAYTKPKSPSAISKGSPSPRRLANVIRLGAIEEDGGMQPDIPDRAPNRPVARLFHIPFPMYNSRAPPAYTEYNDITGPRGEKFSELRNNKRLPRRGGLVRLFVIGLIAFLIIIALAVGLGVGLKGSGGNHGSNAGLPPPQNNTQPFPAGSYSFETYLNVISTNCTSNPNTWRCYPYETYNQSTTGADTIFNWIITPTADNSSNYLISTSHNPFALDFSNVTLTLVDVGLSTEAYTFSTNMQKIVVPTAPLTSDGAATDCFYNGTIFSGKLYTKMRKTYPFGNMTSPSGNNAYQPWPYAVEAQQNAVGGSGVPDCYTMFNGNPGEHVDVATVSSPQDCLCSYQNYGT